MGMAASQARYLALAARKSNCEYEGQQINQARLTLANQSANLFNQMLGLSVPVPPSTQDYTRTQYSFNDGAHAYVLDSWKQLSVADPDYNNMVTTHYYTDVYTGSVKRMVDPQVQISNNGNGISPIAQIATLTAQLRAAEDIMNQRYSYWLTTKSAKESQIELLMRQAQSSNAIGYRGINTITNTTSTPGSGYDTYTLAGDGCEYSVRVYDHDGAIPTAGGSDPRILLEELHNMVDLGVISLESINTALWNRSDSSYGQITDVSQLDFDGSYTDIQRDILATFAIANDVNDSGNKYIVLARDVEAIHEDGGGNFGGYQVRSSDGEFKTTTTYLNEIDECQRVIDGAYDAYIEAKQPYDECLANYMALAQPTYVGNCQLTYLDTLTEDQEIELKQVVKDMIAQNIDTDIVNHFDEYGNYLGGVYSFTMYGVTYYTTYENLCEAYASNNESNNYIDIQYRMPYYNAAYISTRVDWQGKALLETDGSGRFKTIRFEHDSATYTLNMETITDEDAYNDAMNQYYYENAKYDKTVQDINAKTSIIQREDKELELRLKQLETEQNALKTEMDAVQKVVKDNVESTFKTFGG